MTSFGQFGLLVNCPGQQMQRHQIKNVHRNLLQVTALGRDGGHLAVGENDARSPLAAASSYQMRRTAGYRPSGCRKIIPPAMESVRVRAVCQISGRWSKEPPIESAWGMLAETPSRFLAMKRSR